ncbi:MAG TPA: polysaccharide biosynthesis tyrosine autokinase [Vicinamibacterales bacterium]|nr:polysaccharide biosynthesis tyrosine autokinase [Vicinamibacterales bacterium]
MSDRPSPPSVKPAAQNGAPMLPPGGPPPTGTPRPTTAAPATFTASDEVHILDRLAVLYRYRHVAIAVFILTTAAMMIQGYSTIQIYQARAQILIEDERSTAVPGITTPENTYYEDPEPYYKTQYRILKGRDLTRRVVKRVHLERVPEFNGTAAPPSGPAVFVHNLEQRLIGLVKPSTPAAAVPAEPPKADESSDESALVSAFLGRVDVIPITGSRLVDVTFTAMDPTFAATAVNTLVDEYVDQNLQLKQQATQNMLDWLDKEVGNQQLKVQESERALASYRDRQNALSLDEKQNIVLARVNKLNDDVMMSRTKRAQKEVLYNQIKAIQSGQPSDTIPAVAQSAAVQTAKGRLIEAQRTRAQLQDRYGEKHPLMQKALADLQEAQRQYDLEVGRAVQSIKNDYDTAVLEEQTMSRALDAAKADAQDLSRKSVDYNVMEREANSNRQIYQSLLQRENELRVSSNSHANNVRVVDHAEIPKAPITPTGRRTWLVSLGIGLVLAIAVAYGLDYMNDTIKTPEDVTRRLKMHFLGLVPSVRGDKHPLLASARVPHDFGESFRALRTSLLARFPGPGTKIIVVTSAQPLEGKTTTAANIAMALAYGGSRVLLIDADMRRPGLHRPLRLTNERGLSQVLVGQARVRDVIQRTVDPNLLAITAGHPPPNPSELLASERMKTLLTNLAHGPFDWIIVDTPPVLAVTDAVILAPLVAGVVFVIGAEMTRRRLAERAIETVAQTQPKFTAVVLNKVDFARNRYYYSRYYGHQYKNYYAEAAV